MALGGFDVRVGSNREGSSSGTWRCLRHCQPEGHSVSLAQIGLFADAEEGRSAGTTCAAGRDLCAERYSLKKRTGRHVDKRTRREWELSGSDRRPTAAWYWHMGAAGRCPPLLLTSLHASEWDLTIRSRAIFKLRDRIPEEVVPAPTNLFPTSLLGVIPPRPLRLC